MKQDEEKAKAEIYDEVMTTTESCEIESKDIKKAIDLALKRNLSFKKETFMKENLDNVKSVLKRVYQYGLEDGKNPLPQNQRKLTDKGLEAQAIMLLESLKKEVLEIRCPSCDNKINNFYKITNDGITTKGFKCSKCKTQGMLGEGA